MIPASLRQALLLWVARWLKAWAEQVLAQSAPAPAERPTEELEPPFEAPLEDDGPPAHWVEWVRQGAPELLMGLDLRRQASHRSAPGAARPTAAGDRARANDPRTARRAAGPARHVQPGGDAPAEATPEWTPEVDPSPAAEGLPAHAAPAPNEPLPPLAGRAAPTSASAPEPPARAEGPRPGPHGVLRWSERVRRRLELESRPPRRQDQRPPPSEDARWPDQAPPSLQEEVRWPTEERARPEPLAGRLDFAPERWPELPAEEETGETEEGLVRRLERQRRIEREQRGE